MGVRTTGQASLAPRLSYYGADVAIHAECFWTFGISKLCCFGLLLGYSSFRSLKEPGRITFWTSTKRNSHKRLKYCRMCSAPERWDRFKPWMHCTCVKYLLIWQWWCKSSLVVFIDRTACISLEIIGHYLARQIIKITQNRTVQYLVKQINTALMLNIYVTEFIISEDLVANLLLQQLCSIGRLCWFPYGLYQCLWSSSWLTTACTNTRLYRHKHQYTLYCS